MATHLITGANGYVGFHVLLNALEAGHRIVATVRNKERKEEILGNKYIKGLLSQKGADSLELVEIPNILDPKAYDGILSTGTIKYVIHTASPLPFPTENGRADIIEPSVLGTVNMLKAASRVKSVRRIVLTSSVLGNMPFPPSPETTTRPSDRLPDPSEEDMNRRDLDFFTAYRFSKIAALNATDRFVKDNQGISFDVVNVFPGFIHGGNLLADTPERLRAGTNRLLLRIWTGEHAQAPRLACAVHIKDISKIHMAALDENAIPYRSGIDVAGTIPVKWDDAWPILEAHFPEAIKTGTLKKGVEVSVPANWDASSTEKIFNMKLRSFETMVVDLAAQYLSLVDATPT